MLDQRRKPWADVVQMLYECFVFARILPCKAKTTVSAYFTEADQSCDAQRFVFVPGLFQNQLALYSALQDAHCRLLHILVKTPRKILTI